MENIIQELIKFQKIYPNIYIGGSVSLILQDYIPLRIPKDIDIISKEEVHIYDLFNINKPKPRFLKMINYKGLKYDLFFNPKAEFINFETKFGILKISPVKEIIQAKEKMLKLFKYNEQTFNKHTNDIKNIKC